MTLPIISTAISIRLSACKNKITSYATINIVIIINTAYLNLVLMTLSIISTANTLKIHFTDSSRFDIEKSFVTGNLLFQ